MLSLVQAESQGIQGFETNDENELPLPSETWRRFDDLQRVAGVHQSKLSTFSSIVLADSVE